MEKLLIAVLIFLSVGCTTNHYFMDKAKVGYVDGHAVVLFDAGTRNGVHYFRPQFQSDCHSNKFYFDEQSSTGCVIRADRIADIHSYREHTPLRGNVNRISGSGHSSLESELNSISSFNDQ